MQWCSGAEDAAVQRCGGAVVRGGCNGRRECGGASVGLGLGLGLRLGLGLWLGLGLDVGFGLTALAPTCGSRTASASWMNVIVIHMSAVRIISLVRVRVRG